MVRSRDEQMRAINSQIGDVDKLRDILKERERLIEEQRVGLVNQESQLKDLAAVVKQRDQLAEERKGGQAKLQSAVEQAVSQAVTELRAKADKEKQELVALHNAKAQEVADLKNQLAAATPSEETQQELSSTRGERDQYRSRVAELDAMVKELQKAAAATPPRAWQPLPTTVSTMRCPSFDSRS